MAQSSTVLTIGVGQLILQPAADVDLHSLRLWVAVDTHGVTEPLVTERKRPPSSADPSARVSAPVSIDLGFRAAFRVAHGGATHEALLRLLRTRVDDSVFQFTLHGLARDGKRLLLGSVAIQLHALVKGSKDVRDESMLLHVDGRVTGSLRVSVEGVAHLSSAAGAAAPQTPIRRPLGVPNLLSPAAASRAQPTAPAVGGAYARVTAGALWLQVLVGDVLLGSDAWESWPTPPDQLWVEVDLTNLCGVVLRTQTVPVPAQHVPVSYDQTIPLDGPDGELTGSRLEARLATTRRADDLAVLFRVWAILPGAGVLCVGIASLNPLSILLDRADLLGVALVAKPPQRARRDGDAQLAPDGGDESAAAERERPLLPQADGPAVAVLTVSLVGLDALRAFSRRAQLESAAALARAGALPKPPKLVSQRVEREALLAAASSGDLQGLRALLRPADGADRARGADVNRAADGGGHTPLHWAAANGHADVVRALLDEAVPRASVSATNLAGATPLHLAAAWNRVAAARALLLGGARTDVRTLDGATPSAVACAHAGDERARARMRALLEGGAERARAEEREEHLQRRQAERERGAAREEEARRARGGGGSGGADGAAATRIQASYRGRRVRRQK